jgi:hypothetical protein
MAILRPSDLEAVLGAASARNGSQEVLCFGLFTGICGKMLFGICPLISNENE